MEVAMKREWIAEGLGTFLIVFMGTGAAMLAAMDPGKVSHGMVSAAFGLAVAVAVGLFGGISGAHLNPAITLGLALGGRASWRTVPGYVASQGAGAVMASLGLRMLMGDVGKMGATTPVGGTMASLGVEFLFTFLLALAGVLASGKPGSAGYVGAVVGLEAMVGGPVSGASMNPARSLGPALVSGCWDGHWIYWVGPVLGAALAIPAARWLSAHEHKKGAQGS